MPRRRRTGSAGLIFHVINRGAKRSQLFESASEYAAFENLLFDTREAVQIPLLAYCLMPNHWHLVVWPERDQDLSQFMHHLTCTHAQRWNARRGISGEGAVYQGRFKAIPVERDDHFLRLCRYVERNPLRAGLVRLVNEWRWSSLWRRLNQCDHRFLAAWPAPRPTHWLDLLQEPAPDEEAELLRAAIRCSMPFGSEPWRAETAQRLNLPPVLRVRGRPKNTSAQ
jgi:REP-associated tyrosine transposase